VKEFRVETTWLEGEDLAFAQCGGCGARKDDLGFVKVTLWSGTAGQTFQWCEFCFREVHEGLRFAKEGAR
jgi:hypothetical protein